MMNETFYEKLFAGKVNWVLHTTYTCNMDYVAALIKAQYTKEIQSAGRANLKNTAVFYHQSESVTLRCSDVSRKTCLHQIGQILHPLKSKQTHHAKLSLVQYTQNGKIGYRLAVYSKNLEFSPNLENALLFELKIGEKETDSGQQLCSYLEKLKILADEAGKEWIEKKIDTVRNSLGRITLISEFDDRRFDLFFGGCGDFQTLGHQLALHSATNRSVILTPPEFLRGTAAWDYFQNNLKRESGPILYDSGKASHLKLYLLEKRENENLKYEFWVGSANATVHGLGWNFEKNQSKGDCASVECLIKTCISEEEFNDMKEGIKADFVPFSFDDNSQGSLKVPQRDLFGPWVCSNFKIKELEHKKEKSILRVALCCSPDLSIPQFDSSSCVWRPAEYRESCSCKVNPDSKGEWVLEYPYKVFCASQGVLLFGSSAMIIPREYLNGIKLATDHYIRDTRLSDWLLSHTTLENVKEEEDFSGTEEDARAAQYYRWLKQAPDVKDRQNFHGLSRPSATMLEKNTSVTVRHGAESVPVLPGISEADKQMKERPMAFQENAAKQMVKILKTNSRVFLADEAGLGKTYSVADAVCKIAKEKWQNEGDAPKPYYCMYVAPNKALLYKCAKDFQKKAEGMLGGTDENIIILQKNGKTALKAALNQYYDNVYNEKVDTLSKKNKGDKGHSLSSEWIEGIILKKTLEKMGYGSYYSQITNHIQNIRDEKRKEGTQFKSNYALRDAFSKVLGKSLSNSGNDDWNTKIKPNYTKIARKIAEEIKLEKRREDFDRSKKEAFFLVNEQCDNISRSECKEIIRTLKSKLEGTLKDENDIIYAPANWNTIKDSYDRIVASNPDRLINHDTYLEMDTPAGKTIVLLLVSAGCLLDETAPEWENSVLNKKLDNVLKKQENSVSEKWSRSDFTLYFLKKYGINAIIWDEFHRYTTKFENKVYKKILSHEIESNKIHLAAGLKSFFLSATPYRTNISGDDDKKAIEQLYGDIQNKEKEELTQLPSFEQFANLFCTGFGNADKIHDLKNIHAEFAACPFDQGRRAALQNILRTRMIRHERTQLQGEMEQHIRLYSPRELCEIQYAPILRNTAAQSRILEKAGFSEGDRKWALTVPWILSFYKENNSNKQRLNPLGKNLSNDLENMFVYNESHHPIADKLLTLPQQTLPFHELCQENLSDEMTQLLWVPPTVPLYQPGEKSIFYRYRDYSKMLVFAEYHYFQKGGALLLSDYAKLKNKVAEHPIPEQFPPALGIPEYQCLFSVSDGDYRKESLDKLLENMVEKIRTESKVGTESEKNIRIHALSQIAHPFVCAKALVLNSMSDRNISEAEAAADVTAKNISKAFEIYFSRDGVRDALWKWITDHGYSDHSRWLEGILRYCAEGNLYAVLEEWQFVSQNKSFEQLCDVLKAGCSDKAQMKPLETTFAKVAVNSFGEIEKKIEIMKEAKAGERIETDSDLNDCRRQCSFADRLTGDIGDVKSGDNDEAISACAERFSSPFWPMVMFAGRGAQEGMDFHQYCLKIMHMTIPRGAVSFDQRNGRIDRFRSLLVRRRAAELLDNVNINGTGQALLKRMFAYLLQHSELKTDPKDQLFPNWHIPDRNSRHHFQQLFPVWEFTEDFIALQVCDAMLESYRRPFGTSAVVTKNAVDLSAPDCN